MVADDGDVVHILSGDDAPDNHANTSNVGSRQGVSADPSDPINVCPVDEPDAGDEEGDEDDEDVDDWDQDPEIAKLLGPEWYTEYVFTSLQLHVAFSACELFDTFASIICVHTHECWSKVFLTAVDVPCCR